MRSHAAAPSMPAAAAGVEPHPIAAWNAYVAKAIPQAHTCRAARPCEVGEPEGSLVPVPGGTIHHWRGSTLVRRTTVGQGDEHADVPGDAAAAGRRASRRVCSAAVATACACT